VSFSGGGKEGGTPHTVTMTLGHTSLVGQKASASELGPVLLALDDVSTESVRAVRAREAWVVDRRIDPALLTLNLDDTTLSPSLREGIVSVLFESKAYLNLSKARQSLFFKYYRPTPGGEGEASPLKKRMRCDEMIPPTDTKYPKLSMACQRWGFSCWSRDGYVQGYSKGQLQLEKVPELDEIRTDIEYQQAALSYTELYTFYDRIYTELENHNELMRLFAQGVGGIDEDVRQEAAQWVEESVRQDLGPLSAKVNNLHELLTLRRDRLLSYALRKTF